MFKIALPYIPVSFIAVLFLTVLLMFASEMGRTRYVLFFPLDNGTGKNAEIRNIHRTGNTDKRFASFINEVILGPVELEMNPVVPTGTKLKSLIWNGNTLYLDFNKHFIGESESVLLNYQERMNYVMENILFNFQRVGSIVITVEGQLPGSTFYKLSEDLES